jgi:hypothetical protein
MTFEERKAAFTKDLRALLEKYDADIDLEETTKGWYTDSDIVVNLNSIYSRDVDGKIEDIVDIGGELHLGNFIDKDAKELK